MFYVSYLAFFDDWDVTTSICYMHAKDIKNGEAQSTFKKDRNSLAFRYDSFSRNIS